MASEVEMLHVNGNLEMEDFSDDDQGSHSDENLGNGDPSVGGEFDLIMGKPTGNYTDGRIKKKAKRSVINLLGTSPVANGPSGVTAAVEGAPTTAGSTGAVRLLKNSRKSRNGFGRGLPKKGGGGGKGTWGKPGSEMLAEGDNENPGDPNYDSDSQDSYVLAALRPELSDEEIFKNVEAILLEYFENSETREVIVSLSELNFGDRKFRIPVIAISLAMEKKPSNRERTSVLISDLYPDRLSQTDIAKGFDYLLHNLSDIVLDTPEAPVILGNFIARAVADDCLPPKFLAEYKGVIECVYAKAAIERADVLLSMKHGLVRLDNVWGVGGGTRPVKYLIKKMVLLLKEYVSSGDTVEAARCLNDLEVPHFHHELVYEAIVMVLEDMNERTADLVCRLLKSLYASVIVTPDQLTRGFERVYESMLDICLDVPNAYTILERFVGKCQSSGFVSDEIVRKLPSRGRKRFVSEGDGGRVKEY
ncbi:hypothetical protein CHUAL_008119 [Chamberlinius hualienensis]